MEEISWSFFKKKNGNRAYEYYFNTDFLKRELFVRKSLHHWWKH